MTFMFAAECQIRRTAIGAGNAQAESLFRRILVLTRVKYPRDVVAISDYGPGTAPDALGDTARLSLIAAPIPARSGALRFSLLCHRPRETRTRGRFAPAYGEISLRWNRHRPTVRACFLAPLSADFIPMRDLALWTFDGIYTAWDRELLGPDSLP